MPSPLPRMGAGCRTRLRPCREGPLLRAYSHTLFSGQALLQGGRAGQGRAGQGVLGAGHGHVGRRLGRGAAGLQQRACEAMCVRGGMPCWCSCWTNRLPAPHLPVGLLLVAEHLRKQHGHMQSTVKGNESKLPLSLLLFQPETSMHWWRALQAGRA